MTQGPVRVSSNANVDEMSNSVVSDVPVDSLKYQQVQTLRDMNNRFAIRAWIQQPRKITCNSLINYSEIFIMVSHDFLIGI